MTVRPSIKPILAPSILAADFTRLGEEIRAVEASGADWIHCDIMDGHFVPNISFGMMVVEAARRVTDLPLDVHLMITEPERYIGAFADAGAAHIIVHAEATPHLHRAIQMIHDRGLKAGVAINPATPIDVLNDILPELDQVLIMTVNPGFGGQKFIPATMNKIAGIRDRITTLGGSHADRIVISTDGGIGAANIRQVHEQGASAFVVGSAIFKAAEGIDAHMKALRSAVGD